jgi:hypothetical protein
MERSLRLAAAGLIAVLALGAFVGAADARKASPTGAQPIEVASSGLTLLTPPFALGELGLELPGVSPAELASVGLLAGPAPDSDGDNLLTVDDDLLDCPNAEFTSIQAAVLAADPYDRIKVCRGLYLEQVDIPDTKDGITLFAASFQQAVIKAPPVMAEPGDIVRVRARDVTIRHFVISGPLPDTLFCSLETRTGVRVDEGGSATLSGNRITEIRSTTLAFFGCQNGIAVLIIDAGAYADVAHNLIDRYQKGGVVVDGMGAAADIHHNEIVGPGPQPTIAPNGVQFSTDATGEVDHNEVSGNSFTGGGFAGTGIILFDLRGDVNVHHNEVFMNDDGISLYTAQNLLISHNYSHDQSIFDGLYAFFDTANNRFEYNRAERNTEHDCHDDSNGPGTGGSANFWIKNHGLTENKPGLCKRTGP